MIGAAMGALPANAYIELNFRPNVQLVSVVRRFVSEFYQRTLGDPDGSSRVALATHELLENAVKYSKDGETTIRIEVSAAAKPREVTIMLRNRAEDSHIAAIREIVDGVAAAKDAFAYYQQLLLAKAKRREGSGLGLARICAEAEMNITLRVDGEDTVELLATTRVAEAA
jgi:anti-sigma regulatory factor (Ser/Thr protein kinase)